MNFWGTPYGQQICNVARAVTWHLKERTDKDTMQRGHSKLTTTNSWEEARNIFRMALDPVFRKVQLARSAQSADASAFRKSEAQKCG
jgi:hypothetical protein